MVNVVYGGGWGMDSDDGYVDGSASVAISGGNISGSIYGGGRGSATVTGASTVSVSGNPKIGGIGATNAGIRLDTITDNRVTISGALTGADGAIVIIPEETAENTVVAEATTKSHADAAKLALAGVAGYTLAADATAGTVYITRSGICTVTYDANGGTGTMAASTATVGAPFALPDCTFTPPAGKQFRHWAVGGTDGTTVNAGGTHVFTTDTTVYAIWEDFPVVTTITVKLILDFGPYAYRNVTLLQGDVVKYTLIQSGDSPDSGTLYKNDAVLSGEYDLYVDGEYIDTIYLDKNGSVLIYNFHTVTFDANGGAPVPPEQIVLDGSLLTEPVGVTRENYKLEGWYTDSGLTRWIFATSTVKDTIILYAKWTLDQPYKYTMISGGGGNWFKGGLNGLGFKASGDYAKFSDVSADGSNISNANYSSEPGSTVVTLKAAYLETLAMGIHTLRINFTDGYAETTFTVSAAPKPPKTGDNSTPLVWLALCLVCGAGAVLMLTRRRRKA